MRRRRREHSLLLKASKMLVSWAQASTSHSATGGERYGHFRSGGEGRRDPPPRPRETLMLRAPVPGRSGRGAPVALRRQGSRPRHLYR